MCVWKFSSTNKEDEGQGSVIVVTSEKRSTGFTLIELMSVVVIIAVLTMVAYPAYQSFTVKANRAEAKSYLMDVAQKEHLYFNDTRTYAEEDELNSPPPERVAKNYAVLFEISTIDPPPTFTITATPKSNTPQEGDGDLSIDNTGEKLHAGEAW
jgi:type IV pilus assembly protein PilE